MSVHPSGWFRYQNESYGPRAQMRTYRGCTLLCDLPFDTSTRQFMSVTFHQDDRCIQGASLPVIVELADGQLMGWSDEDDPVLDLYGK